MTSAILTLMVEMAFHNAHDMTCLVILFKNYFSGVCLKRLTGTPLTLSSGIGRPHLSVPINTNNTYSIRFVFSSWNYYS